MTTSRNAVVLDAHGGPEVMRLVEEPLPELARDTVRIEVEAVGVNFGDTLIRRGEYYRDAPLSIRPGFEVSGRVLDAAPGIDLRPGERVAAFVADSGYATVVAAQASHVVRVPDAMSSRDAAALLIQGLTAWYAVHRYGATRPGERVLVHAAAGGVGGIAVQLVRLAGATPIATASTPAKRRAALDRGAEAALDPDPGTLRDGLREVLSGAQLDVVLDAVGGALFMPGMRSLGLGGRYVVYGAASREPSTLDARILMPRGLRVSAFVLAAVFSEDPAEPAHAFDRLAALLSAGDLSLEVTALPFERYAEAHQLIESRQLKGKIVLEPARNR
jgi:NADPH2:quinone reductase